MAAVCAEHLGRMVALFSENYDGKEAPVDTAMYVFSENASEEDTIR